MTVDTLPLTVFVTHGKIVFMKMKQSLCLLFALSLFFTACTKKKGSLALKDVLYGSEWSLVLEGQDSWLGQALASDYGLRFTAEGTYSLGSLAEESGPFALGLFKSEEQGLVLEYPHVNNARNKYDQAYLEKVFPAR